MSECVLEIMNLSPSVDVCSKKARFDTLVSQVGAIAALEMTE